VALPVQAAGIVIVVLDGIGPLLGRSDVPEKKEGK